MARKERPLGPGDDLVVEFAAGLRQLRDEAGGPTYRTLAARAGYSAAALSEAAGGRKLPGLALTTAYVGACGGDVEKWETRWREAAARLAAESTPGPEAQTPYLGLAAFQPADADRFFGREKLVGELTAKLSERRFVGVFGASGSGKSSLLRAGLAGERAARVRTPGEHPLSQCADALAETGRLLVVDQFEEVFTLCRDDAERAAFIGALLARAADEHGSQVVLGVRADFYGHCGRHAELVDALRDAQILVGPMTAEELRTAIVEPAVRHGCQVESALVTTLVADAAGRPAVLPLVSHALLETWRRRQGITLTLAAYEAAGGIRNAIAHTADAVYGELAPGQQAKVRQIFLRLTALGEGTEDTKRRLRRRELDDDPATTEVLERLAAARLVSLDHDGAEIAHEALIRSWPRLQDWLAEDREGHRLHRQLAEATDLWESLDRDAGSLYRGTRLGLAAEWAARSPDALTAREQAFLDAGRAQETAEADAVRRRTRRLRQLAALLGVLLILAGVATGFAIDASRTATDQRNVALARKAVGDAADLRQTNPALSVQLSLAAYRLAPVREARDGLLGTLGSPFAGRLSLAPEGIGFDGGAAVSGDGRLLATGSDLGKVQVWSLRGTRQPVLLAKLPEPVRNPVAFSPDGRTLATGTADSAFRLWDLSDPRAPVARGLTEPQRRKLNTAEFSPDGRLLATGADDGTVRLTDVTDPARPKTVSTLGPDLQRATFRGDGRVLATGTSAKTEVLWDVADPARPRRLAELTGHTGLVNASAFSPDGRLLATTSWDTTVRLWDVSTPSAPRPLATLPGTGIVWVVAFSPDGRTLAAAGDPAARLFDVSDPAAPAPLITLAGHTNSVTWLGFADGMLLTASADRTLRLQDLALLDLAARGGCCVRFDDSGRLMITTGKGPQLWTVPPDGPPRLAARLPGVPGEVTAIVAGHDGRSVALAALTDAGGVLERWDVTRPDRPRLVARTTTRPAYSLAFSPDGRVLATGYDDGPIQLWDVSDPSRIAAPVTLPSPDGTVWSLKFTPDGGTLYAGRGGATPAVTRWDVTDRLHPRLTTTLRAGTGAFLSLALSRDGRFLVGGSTDTNAYLWDVSGAPRLLSSLTGHTDTVGAVSIGPSGTLIATAGYDRSMRLWDVSDPAHPIQTTAFGGFPDSAYTIVLLPDGRRVAIGAGTIRLLELDPERVARQICGLADPKITPAEWGTYFPGVPYTPPCP
ncbi:hypothetical protein [Amycolatopsis sp. NPDC021455]|uniref:nSTAND1 domain-containing NTPase n=1 Tax=Amycolatopsis sp. NPDC021455 TaxID=3154901 RepID=UPI0033EA5D82